MREPIFLREWQTAGPDDNTRLASPFPLTPEERSFVAELGRSGRVEILEVRNGLRIVTRSYVGSLRLGRTTVHIRPKLAELSPAAMATFLRYALGMDMVRRWDSAVDVPLDEGGFADLIALALLDQIDVLLRAGILRDYETHAAWRSSPRGRLDFSELARHPMRAQTAVSIPCRVSETVTDTALNRLLGATLEAMRALVIDPTLALNLHSRSALLEELVQKAPLTPALLQEADAAMDRRSGHYQPVLEIAALILAGLGATIDDARQKLALSSFLLDMNLLFERFVSRLLRDYCPPGLRVETQRSQDVAYRWRENPYAWRRPSLRPDILLYDAATNELRLILDAKYKPLGADRRPTPEDLYQLTLYSLAFGAQGYVRARIVFPDTANHTADASPALDFQGQSRSQAIASVSFYGLPMVSLAEALKANEETALRQIALALIA